ncbi:hypothetical protein NY053_03955 [Corynebacterium diphtheriae bv. mitis]|nr:hypothetical protein NY053_03955 [Corynebacterium diphtheriae bv. mitis]UWE92737.1 hypothetical protein NY044_03955 [Corynebacterium diphtheriae bv. mitis]
MTSPDPTTIPTILRLVENIWQGQPNLSLVAILDILRNHGLDWDSTPSDTIAILRAYLDDFPTTLSEDTLASGRTFRIRTTSPHLGIHHLRASHSRPRQRPHDVGIRAPHPRRNPPTTAYRRPPLRRHHAHRQPRRSHPATATSLLVTLAPFLHDAPTLVLSNASTRKVIAYTTKNRRKESSILSGNLIKYAIGGRCVVASPSGEVVDLGEVVSVMAVG